MMFCILFSTGCSDRVKNEQPINNVSKMEVRKDFDLNIMTTDKLVYNMIKTIVKDKHVVEYMFKDREIEVNFKFTEDSLNNISKKDLFIYVGAGFEPWIDSFVDKVNKSRVGVINVSRGVKLLPYNKTVKYNDTVLKENPYYFMNADNYKIVLMNIKNAIQDKDPKNRDFYEKNFAEELKNLESYQKELKTVADSLSQYSFIQVEDQLDYFIKYNNLKILNINTPENSVSILPLTLNEQKNVESQLNSSTVLIYNNDGILKSNEDIIKKYNIKVAKIEVYNGQFSYEEALKRNIDSLKSISKIK